MGRALRGVGRLLISLTLIVVCAVALLTAVVPRVIGAESFTVLTGSMKPGLQPGDMVVVRAVPIDDVHIGDVITYQLRSGEGEVVTHRVVGFARGADGQRRLIMRGDANSQADAAPVMPVQVRGRLVYSLRWLGFVNLWAGNVDRRWMALGGGATLIGVGVVLLVRGRAKPAR